MRRAYPLISALVLLTGHASASDLVPIGRLWEPSALAVIEQNCPDLTLQPIDPTPLRPHPDQPKLINLVAAAEHALSILELEQADRIIQRIYAVPATDPDIFNAHVASTLLTTRIAAVRDDRQATTDAVNYLSRLAVARPSLTDELPDGIATAVAQDLSDRFSAPPVVLNLQPPPDQLALFGVDISAPAGRIELPASIVYGLRAHYADIGTFPVPKSGTVLQSAATTIEFKQPVHWVLAHDGNQPILIDRNTGTVRQTEAHGLCAALQPETTTQRRLGQHQRRLRIWLPIATSIAAGATAALVTTLPRDNRGGLLIRW